MKLDINPNTPTGARWAAMVGTARAADATPPRKKRFTGPTAESKAWEREQAARGGRFIRMALPNWANCTPYDNAQAAIQRSRKAKQHTAARAEVLNWGVKLPPPLVVTLTRYGPRTLDDDGLRSSLKYVRDGVAGALGIDDGDTARIRFAYAQEKSRWCAVRIEVASAPVRPTRDEAEAVVSAFGDTIPASDVKWDDLVGPLVNVEREWRERGEK